MQQKDIKELCEVLKGDESTHDLHCKWISESFMGPILVNDLMKMQDLLTIAHYVAHLLLMAVEFGEGLQKKRGEVNFLENLMKEEAE